MEAIVQNRATVTDSNGEISEVFNQQRSKLFNFIRKNVSSTEDAEDILMEVFYRFVNQYRLPEEIEQSGAWLFRVARNKIIDFFRKKKTLSLEDKMRAYSSSDNEDDMNVNLPFMESSSGEELYAGFVWEEFQNALSELPQGQREVFEAHELQGKSFEQLAEETGEPKNTLISRKRYAVVYLRKRLKNLYDEL